MRKTYQFSLFSTGTGKGLLFSTGVLKQYLDEHRTTPIPAEKERATAIREWLDALRSTKAAESTLEQQFNQRIMSDVLGYRIYPAADGIASLYPKPPKRITAIARTPDAVLGAFTDAEMRFTAALELKSPGTDLDAPQPRENNETPVEQGFHYGRRILAVRWVLVSDMRVLRLYSVDSPAEYEEFDLRLCVDDDGATEEFRRLFFLLHHDFLVQGHDTAPVSQLYAKSYDRQLSIRDSFYRIYFDIRADLFEAIRQATLGFSPPPTRPELLQATQRLLDRMLFIYYCEDHPQALIPKDTVRSITSNARRMPGPSPSKVYDALKYLFREIDSGSSPHSGVQVAGYNGELFKIHPIVDHIDLPDTLHDREYRDPETTGSERRVVKGVWGLHAFDFWTDLNEHLLGHIFEESLSDLEHLRDGEPVSVAEKLHERKTNGIYYTAYVLSDFLAGSALHAVLDERASIADEKSKDQLNAALESRMKALLDLRVLDPAAGSGAFLVSAYREMLEEYWRVRALMETTASKKRAATLFDTVATQDQAKLLRSSLYGADLLPQAIEIAKLALWLRSARKGEKVADLGGNLISCDSLSVPDFFARLQVAPGSFDLVIGNPPWGGHIEPETRKTALAALALPAGSEWDTWELFVLLGLRALREGGRLAFVLPDSFFYPAKKRLRELVLSSGTLEKVHNLGPDWFGKHVRMGTVVVQIRRGPIGSDDDALCAVLAGSLRTQAIEGKVPLTQVEAQRARRIPMARVLASPTFEVEVLRGRDDDDIMTRMAEHGIALGSLCTRGRGEEMNKAGLGWICGACSEPTTPGEKAKGGGFKPKQCPTCGHLLIDGNVQTVHLVHEMRAGGGDLVPYVDGDDVARRYQVPRPSKWLDVGVSGWRYKDSSLYAGPKILVRQAGVGIVATLDETDARCPQSVYLYRLTPEHFAAGYRHEYVLAALLSRAMTYYVFKRYAEVDPAKAHAKLTHQRLSHLPIPVVNFSNASSRKLHDEIVTNARKLLDGTARIGDVADREIERALWKLWHLTPADGAHINQEFADVPDGQVVRDLFPMGRPKPGTIVLT